MTAGGELYRKWKDWSEGTFGTLPRETEVYYDRELSRAGIGGQGLDVLEIGFGNGGFASFARARGWTYAGTEIDPALVARAREAGFDVSPAGDLTALFGDRRFDAISAFDVLEHLTQDEIIAILSQIRTLLKPGGRFVARFPSGDSPFSFGMQNGDITHRTHIGSGMVRQFSLAAGLRPEQIRAPVYPVTGLGLRRGVRRALVAAARVPVRAFVRIVFHDNQPRVIDPNMLIVLSADTIEG